MLLVLHAIFRMQVGQYIGIPTSQIGAGICANAIATDKINGIILRFAEMASQEYCSAAL